MYTFDDRGGRSLTLRPELTAGLMRAFIEHRLHDGALPVKLWTVGSAFRYERPQAGRYRHFTQVDMEALGTDDPALDAEVVALGVQGFRDLGLTDFELLLTSLGDSYLTGRSTASCWSSSSPSSTWTRTPAAARRSTRCGCSTTSGPRCRPSSTTPR